MNVHRIVAVAGCGLLLSVTALAAFDEYRVRVEDHDGKRTEKRLDLKGRSVRLVRRFSGACREGRDWGFTDRVIWVKNHCQAEFEISDRWGRDRDAYTVRVEDNDGKRTDKRIDLRGKRVRLIRQLSNDPCREGRDWGYSREGIWVRNHCKGLFEVSDAGRSRDRDRDRDWDRDRDRDRDRDWNRDRDR